MILHINIMVLVCVCIFVICIHISLEDAKEVLGSTAQLFYGMYKRKSKSAPSQIGSKFLDFFVVCVDGIQTSH